MIARSWRFKSSYPHQQTPNRLGSAFFSPQCFKPNAKIPNAELRLGFYFYYGKKSEREMKKYRIFWIKLSEVVLSTQWFAMGLGNIDQFYDGCFARQPSAAVLRVLRCERGPRLMKCNDLSELLKKRQGTMSCVQAENAGLFEFLDQLRESDIAIICAAYKHKNFAMLCGKDIIPVNLSTAPNYGALHNTACLLAGKAAKGQDGDYLNHVLYSDFYLSEREKQK